MNIEYRIRGLKDNEQLRAQLLAELEALNGLIPITHVHLALERQLEVAPAYQAAVMLAVPGPDIHAAARDHTWPAAWRKVITRLREQIEKRWRQQTARHKGQPFIHNSDGRKAK